MNDVIKLSTRLGRVSALLLWIIPLGWLGFTLAAMLNGQVQTVDGIHPVQVITWQGRAALAAVASLHVVVLWLIVMRLHQLFRLYAQGLIFEAQTCQLYARLGNLIIGYAVVDTASSAMPAPLLAWLSGIDVPQDVHLNLPVLLIGLVVILLARIMTLASSVAEENQLTI